MGCSGEDEDEVVEGVILKVDGAAESSDEFSDNPVSNGLRTTKARTVLGELKTTKK